MHSSLLSSDLSDHLNVSKTQELHEPLILDCEFEAPPKKSCFGLGQAKLSTKQKCSNIAFEQSEIDEERRKDVEMENKRASIDFKEMFQKYRERTEMNAPHIYI